MNPTLLEIKAARLAARLTQTQAGALVDSALTTWQSWEVENDKKSHRNMPVAKWQLFKMLIALKAE